MRVFITRMGAHKYVLAHQVYACAVTSVRYELIYAFDYHQCVWGAHKYVHAHQVCAYASTSVRYERIYARRHRCGIK